jgi:long-subunit acyl-CoA synthetase (AMP-forming)
MRNMCISTETNTLDKESPCEKDAVVISYLPTPHLFEQCNIGAVLLHGMRLGYYCGNPLKLLEDC